MPSRAEIMAGQAPAPRRGLSRAEIMGQTAEPKRGLSRAEIMAGPAGPPAPAVPQEEAPPRRTLRDLKAGHPTEQRLYPWRSTQPPQGDAEPMGRDLTFRPEVSLPSLPTFDTSTEGIQASPSLVGYGIAPEDYQGTTVPTVPEWEQPPAGTWGEAINQFVSNARGALHAGVGGLAQDLANVPQWSAKMLEHPRLEQLSPVLAKGVELVKPMLEHDPEVQGVLEQFAEREFERSEEYSFGDPDAASVQIAGAVGSLLPMLAEAALFNIVAGPVGGFAAMNATSAFKPDQVDSVTWDQAVGAVQGAILGGVMKGSHPMPTAQRGGLVGAVSGGVHGPLKEGDDASQRAVEATSMGLLSAAGGGGDLSKLPKDRKPSRRLMKKYVNQAREDVARDLLLPSRAQRVHEDLSAPVAQTDAPVQGPPRRYQFDKENGALVDVKTGELLDPRWVRSDGQKIVDTKTGEEVSDPPSAIIEPERPPVRDEKPPPNPETDPVNLALRDAEAADRKGLGPLRPEGEPPVNERVEQGNRLMADAERNRRSRHSGPSADAINELLAEAESAERKARSSRSGQPAKTPEKGTQSLREALLAAFSTEPRKPETRIELLHDAADALEAKRIRTGDSSNPSALERFYRLAAEHENMPRPPKWLEDQLLELIPEARAEVMGRRLRQGPLRSGPQQGPIRSGPRQGPVFSRSPQGPIVSGPDQTPARRPAPEKPVAETPAPETPAGIVGEVEGLIAEGKQANADGYASGAQGKLRNRLAKATPEEVAEVQKWLLSGKAGGQSRVIQSALEAASKDRTKKAAADKKRAAKAAEKAKKKPLLQHPGKTIGQAKPEPKKKVSKTPPPNRVLPAEADLKKMGPEELSALNRELLDLRTEKSEWMTARGRLLPSKTMQEQMAWMEAAAAVADKALKLSMRKASESKDSGSALRKASAETDKLHGLTKNPKALDKAASIGSRSKSNIRFQARANYIEAKIKEIADQIPAEATGPRVAQINKQLDGMRELVADLRSHAKDARETTKKASKERPHQGESKEVEDLLTRADHIEGMIPEAHYRKDGKLRKNAPYESQELARQAEQLRQEAKDLGETPQPKKESSPASPDAGKGRFREDAPIEYRNHHDGHTYQNWIKTRDVTETMIGNGKKKMDEKTATTLNDLERKIAFIESELGKGTNITDAMDKLVASEKPKSQGPKTRAMREPDYVEPPGENWSPTFENRPATTADGLARPVPDRPLSDPVRREDVLSQFADDLGVSISVGKKKMAGRIEGDGYGVKGLYTERTEGTHISRHNDLEQAAHEVGHLIADRHPEINEAIENDYNVRRELEMLSYDRSDAAEGWGEFVRSSLTEPIFASSAAPHTTELIKQVRANNPRLDQAWSNAQKGFSEWFQQDALSTASAKVGGSGAAPGSFTAVVAAGRNPGKAATRFELWGRHFWNEWRQGMFDDFHMLAEAEGALRGDVGRAYQTARLSRGKYAVTEGAMRWGFPVLRGDGDTNFKEIHWREPKRNAKGEIIPGEFVHRKGGILDVWAPIEKDGKLDLLMDYMRGRAAADLKKQGRENLHSEAEIKRLVEIEKKNPGFKEAAKAYQDWNRGILEFAADSGLISRGQVDKLMRRFYVPMYRVTDPLKSPTKKASQRNRMHRLTGGTQNVRPMMENIIDNANGWISAAIENRVRQEIAKLAELDKGENYLRRLRDEELEGDMILGSAESAKESFKQQWYENAKDEMALKIEQQNRQLKSNARQSALDRWFADNKAKLSEEVDALWEGIGPALRVAQLNARPRGDNFMPVTYNGKNLWYEVKSPELLRSVAAIRPQSSVPKWFENTFGGARRLSQWTVTRNPAFLLSNGPLRDQMSAGAYGRFGYRPYVDAAKGFMAAATESAEYKQFIARGGGHGGIFNEADARADVNRVLRSKGIKVAWWDPATGWLRKYEEIGDTLESMTRVGASMRAAEKGENWRDATMEGREISTDFAMRGDWKTLHLMHTAIPFLRAGLAGMDKTRRAQFSASEKNNRAKVWAATIGLSIGSSMMAAVNHGNPLYEDLPAWVKDANFVFITPTAEHALAMARGDEMQSDAELIALIKGDNVKKAQAANAEFARRYSLTLIPRNWEMGAIARIAELITEYSLDVAVGEGNLPERAAAARNAFLHAYRMGTPADAALTKPMLETWGNWDQFRDRPILSKADQAVVPGLQEGRSELLAKIGAEMANLPPEYQISPKVVEHWIRSFTGVMGDTGLELLDRGAFAAGITEGGADRQLPINPLKRFAPEDFYSDAANQLYTEAGKSSMLASTIMAMAKTPHLREQAREMAKGPRGIELGVSKALGGAKSAFSKLREVGKFVRHATGDDLDGAVKSYTRSRGDKMLTAAVRAAGDDERKVRKIVQDDIRRQINFHARRVNTKVSEARAKGQ